jgi:hypothetical protein
MSSQGCAWKLVYSCACAFKVRSIGRDGHILVVHNHNKFDSRNARLMSKPCLKGLSRSCSSDHIAELWCSAVAQQGHTELNWAISRVLAAEIVILYFQMVEIV